jgi:hypothetical protein
MKLYSEGGDKLPVIGRYGIMRRLTRIWRDLKNEQQWKYRELPPATLFEALKLNLLYADESEFARAGWFWLRRPKPFTESLLRSLICVSGGPLLLFVPKAGLALSLAWCLGVRLAAIAEEVRLIIWRREYELSIDRLIRTLP